MCAPLCICVLHIIIKLNVKRVRRLWDSFAEDIYSAHMAITHYQNSGECQRRYELRKIIKEKIEETHNAHTSTAAFTHIHTHIHKYTCAGNSAAA